MLKLPNWVIDIDHRPRSKSSTAQTHTAIGAWPDKAAGHARHTKK
jgi:hypothetical protein